MIHQRDFNTLQDRFICDSCHRDITKQAKRALKSMGDPHGKYRRWRAFLPGVPDTGKYLHRQFSFRFLWFDVAITLFK